MPSKMRMGETLNLQHGSATWRYRRENDQDHQRPRINAQEAIDLIKFLRGLEVKTLNILDI
jgi:hypothetical protein